MFQSEQFTDKIEQFNKRKNTLKNSIKLKTIDYVISCTIICFIIGLSCYFSGYSKQIGGKIMKQINVVVIKLCFIDNNNDYEGMYVKQINGQINERITCNVKTGYTFDTIEQCKKILSDKYYVGSNHTVYYNKINDICLTHTEANTISIVGFIFIIFTCVLYLTACIFYKKLNVNWYSDEKIIEMQNELKEIELNLLKINKYIEEENNKINNILNNNDVICTSATLINNVRMASVIPYEPINTNNISHATKIEHSNV